MEKFLCNRISVYKAELECFDVRHLFFCLFFTWSLVCPNWATDRLQQITGGPKKVGENTAINEAKGNERPDVMVDLILWA